MNSHGFNHHSIRVTNARNSPSLRNVETATVSAGLFIHVSNAPGSFVSSTREKKSPNALQTLTSADLIEILNQNPVDDENDNVNFVVGKAEDISGEAPQVPNIDNTSRT